MLAHLSFNGHRIQPIVHGATADTFVGKSYSRHIIGKMLRRSMRMDFAIFREPRLLHLRLPSGDGFHSFLEETQEFGSRICLATIRIMLRRLPRSNSC